jgi:hypothetical protein
MYFLPSYGIGNYGAIYFFFKDAKHVPYRVLSQRQLSMNFRVCSCGDLLSTRWRPRPFLYLAWLLEAACFTICAMAHLAKRSSVHDPVSLKADAVDSSEWIVDSN